MRCCCLFELGRLDASKSRQLSLAGVWDPLPTKPTRGTPMAVLSRPCLLPTVPPSDSIGKAVIPDLIM